MRLFLAVVFFLGVFSNTFSQATFQYGSHNREIIIIPDPNLSDAMSLIGSKIAELSNSGGGILRLASGIYNVPQFWHDSLVSISNVEIIGEGNSTRFVAEDSSVVSIFYLSNCNNLSFKNIKLEGIVLDSSSWGSNLIWHMGFQIKNSENIRIAGNTIYGFYTGGVTIQSSTKIFVQDNIFIDVSYKQAGDYGAVSVEGGSDVHITNNLMTGITHSGISGYGANKLIIANNTIYGNKKSPYCMGVYCVRGLSNSMISNNNLLDIYNEGIVLDGEFYPVKNNVIEGNTITANYSGVTINTYRVDNSNLSAATNNVINGNNISSYDDNVVDHAIFLNKNNSTVVASNTISNSTYGINLQNWVNNNMVNANIVSSSHTCILFNGNGTVVGNHLNNSPKGIVYNYSSKTIISNNFFNEVDTTIVKGSSASGDHVLNNF